MSPWMHSQKKAMLRRHHSQKFEARHMALTHQSIIEIKLKLFLQQCSFAEPAAMINLKQITNVRSMRSCAHWKFLLQHVGIVLTVWRNLQLAHASAVLHSSRCYLNLDAQKASAAIHKATLSKVNKGGTTNAKRFKSEGVGTSYNVPYCHCAVILCCASFVSAGVKRILDVSIFVAVHQNQRIVAIILSGQSNWDPS
jgi:hypothetical protein